jgi:Ca-activated chloride channel family protein
MGINARFVAALGLAVGLSSVFAAGQQQPPATFKAGTRMVPLYVTVTDAERRLVPGLTRDDFEIFDDQKPQAISVFDNEVLPISVVVMLDTSGSMTGSIGLLRAAAEQFLLRLLPKDKAMVGDFNDKIQFVTAGFTGNRDQLVSSLHDIDFGNPTRLWDAIGESLDQLHDIDGRRVVLVFTDGFDEYSKNTSLGTVLDRARNEEVMIYAIGLQSDYFDGRRQVRSKPDRSLRKVAEETGGGYFELDKTAQLASTFTRVEQELHSQYLIGFTPATLDGKVHKVEVRLKKPGMQARARKTYLATNAPTGARP